MMGAMEILIGILYPSLLGLYGDRGNAMIVKKRAERQGLIASLIPIEIGSTPSFTGLDLLIGGGGQDCEQELIQADLLAKGRELRAAVEDGLPFLAICGTYQLLGHYYQTAMGERHQGLGLLDLATIAEPHRLVGNISLQCENLALSRGTLAGFENHSGRTYLGNCKPIGRVLHGHGNNGLDLTEGAVHHHCIGTYLHGPVLALNPHLADFLVDSALMRRYGSHYYAEPEGLELETHLAALSRK